MGRVKTISYHDCGGELRFNREMLAHLEVLPRQQVYVTFEPNHAIRIRPLHVVPPEELKIIYPLASLPTRQPLYDELNRRVALPPRGPMGSPQNLQRARFRMQARHLFKRVLAAVEKTLIWGG